MDSCIGHKNMLHLSYSLNIQGVTYAKNKNSKSKRT